MELSWHSPPTHPCVYFPVLPWAAERCRHHAGCQPLFHLWSLLAFCPSPRERQRLNQFFISMEVIPVLPHGKVPPVCVEDQPVEMRALPRNLCVVMMPLDFVMLQVCRAEEEIRGIIMSPEEQRHNFCCEYAALIPAHWGKGHGVELNAEEVVIALLIRACKGSLPAAGGLPCHGEAWLGDRSSSWFSLCF